MRPYENAIAAIELAIADLHNQAMMVADRYWIFVNEHAKRSTGPEQKSALELTCGSKGNHLEARWSAINWYGTKAKRSRVRKLIAKDTTGLTFKASSLKASAKDWEWEMVQLTEMELHSIRRQLHHLVRAVMMTRNAMAVEKATSKKFEALDSGLRD